MKTLWSKIIIVVFSPLLAVGAFLLLLSPVVAQTGAPTIIFESSHSYPYNVVLVGSIDPPTADPDNGWVVQVVGSHPSISTTKTYTVSEVHVSGEFYQNVPTNWNVGSLTGPWGIWTVWGSNGLWSQREFTASVAVAPGAVISVLAEGTGSGFYWRNITIEITECGDEECPDDEGGTGLDLCPLVYNSHFAISDTTWLLDGTAAISPISSTLTLASGDIAAQNLTLDASTSYNAVISVTDVISGATLNIVLGQASETVEITEPGWYTVTLSTLSTLAGPIIYGLENEGDGTLTIDFTCVSLADESESQNECIAPLNGTFEDESHWNWYRGAEFFYPGNYASLPLADNGMIGTQETYTLPSLGLGEHLLLGFTARGLDDDGAVSGQVTNGADTAEFNFSTYLTEYSYESSLDTLAEDTGVQLSFVNPSDVITGVTSAADVLIDNICVFTATRGPRLPQPTDPNGISPVDIGFNYTSCDDVDGILAYFGVNIQQYRAEYLAGTSVWDPIGWVPWLIAAGWNILATYLCIFMAAFVALVDLLEYILNNILNIGSWIVRSWPATTTWLSGWFNWSRLSFSSVSLSFGTFFSSWGKWLGDLILVIAAIANLTLAAALEWLGWSIVFQVLGVGGFLLAWLSQFDQSLTNHYNWTWDTTLGFINWLFIVLSNLPGLIIPLNLLIAGWNAFVVILGLVFSGVLGDFAWIWNDNLRPFFDAVWAYLGLGSLTLTDLFFGFISAGWEMLKTMVWWVWENIISVGHIPLTFYWAFDGSINAPAYSFVSCSGSNFWCVFLAGVQLLNQLVAHTILYPIIIVGIILSTLWILWDNFRVLFSIEIK